MTILVYFPWSLFARSSCIYESASRTEVLAFLLDITHSFQTVSSTYPSPLYILLLGPRLRSDFAPRWDVFLIGLKDRTLEQYGLRNPPKSRLVAFSSSSPGTGRWQILYQPHNTYTLCILHMLSALSGLPRSLTHLVDPEITEILLSALLGCQMAA